MSMLQHMKKCNGRPEKIESVLVHPSLVFAGGYGILLSKTMECAAQCGMQKTRRCERTDMKRYKKELVADKKAVFRSTLFPASRPLVRGSNLEELITEIVYYIKLK